MSNFWQQLKEKKVQTGKPFFALAPMADVTDSAFRLVVTECGKPDVLWTEFVAADGLVHPKGREKLMYDLRYSESERPIVAQLFSSKPENMRAAARLCSELGFDGIDINMGCPDRTIEKQGCGSAMIKTPERAVEVINAARAGIADAGKNTLLSVKTRVGYGHDEIDTWVRLLLEQNLDALTIHARTRKDLSVQPANWDYISRIVKLRDQISPDTVIIGNGDVTDLQDGMDKATATGADGIMIGRAVFGNPWIFDPNRSVAQRGSWNTPWYVRILPRSWQKRIMGDSRYTVSTVSIQEKLQIMIEHTKLFMEHLGGVKNFAVMKKHYKAYAHGFPGAKELRIKLMESNNAEEVEQIVGEFLQNYQDK